MKATIETITETTETRPEFGGEQAAEMRCYGTLRERARKEAMLRKWYYIGWGFLFIGIFIIVGTRAHHLVVNPLLTEAQALRFYFPLWLAAGGAILGGFAMKNK